LYANAQIAAFFSVLEMASSAFRIKAPFKLISKANFARSSAFAIVCRYAPLKT